MKFLHWLIRPQGLEKLVNETLYDAQRSLLSAKLHQEYWSCQVKMLEQRVRRLKAE